VNIYNLALMFFALAVLPMFYVSGWLGLTALVANSGHWRPPALAGGTSTCEHEREWLSVYFPLIADPK
jgi:hypothetical protein